MSSEFVHLHVHSDYSLLDGACRIDRLCNRAKELGMKALAITDHGNLFGTIDFFQTAQKHQIKPIVGCEVYLTYDHKLTDRPDRSQNKTNHMGLLAQNFQGYQNLIKLVSTAHTQGFYYKPRIDMDYLARHSEGLIGFTGCLQGVIPQFLLKDDMPSARKAMETFISIFGKDRFFVEIQDHGIDLQQKIILPLLQLAQEFNLKVICSNDVHYVNHDDWAPHDSMLCIQTAAKLSDANRMRYSSQQFYLKSPDEMLTVFKDVPHSLSNTLAIAEMCDIKIPFGKNNYPVFRIPDNLKSQFPDNPSYLKHLCIQGLKQRYNFDYDNPSSTSIDPELAQILKTRLDYEVSIIQKTGFTDYFLIVSDFIHWARSQDIPIGPGRGSGAGCLVAYSLKITDIDPIRFKLLFERFLNPERVSPPDFDIDFCMRRRSEVVDYIRNKYGHECVANIITFGTFGAKMILRDLARVNDIPYADADRLAKMVPDDIGITLEDAIQKSPELSTEIDTNPLTAEIIKQGKVLEGMVRNVGTHAAGIIISDKPLTDLIPVTLQEGALTTQYPKDPLEQLGLLKMDLLGLKTLTIIADAQENIRRTRNDPTFNIESIYFEDPKTFELLNNAKTIGVFQLESGGMQSLCKQFNISNIDEIVALIALYRPGPMELIPDYIRGKKDPSNINFAHPLLANVCRETYGIMVYQEQVMEAAQVIAGYTLGGADILRRAMGKKKVEEMQKQREIFVEGASKTNNIDRKKAEEIFNLLEKFAGYGFNKSHSAAYAILAYRTAYLKANYPVEFMAAVLSSELGNADKVAHFVEEAVSCNIPVLGPDINQSFQNFTPIVDPSIGSGSIRFGLAGIKGVGDAATSVILEDRNKNGPFKSLQDLLQRVDSRTVNRRVIECLVKAGAFDALLIDRAQLLDALDTLMSEAASSQKDKAAGQASLFDMLEASSAPQTVSYKSHLLMPLQEKLKNEKELLGFYTSGHPLNQCKPFDSALISFDESNLSSLQDNTPFRICGIINEVTKKISKQDNRLWAILSLSTKKSNYSINLYSDAYAKFHSQLLPESIVILSGIIRNKDGNLRFNAEEVLPFNQKLPSCIQAVDIHIHPKHPQLLELIQTLEDYLHKNPGSTKIRLAIPAQNKLIISHFASSLSCQILHDKFQPILSHPALSHVSITPTPPPQPLSQKRFFSPKNPQKTT